MYYFMVIVATLMFSLQFMFNEKFQQATDDSWNSALKYSLYSAVAGFVLLIFINKFRIDISIFSFLVALVYGILSLLLSYASFKAFTYANLSVFSVFAMIGGMFIPFIFGILTGEPLTLTGVLCCVFITIAVAISANPGGGSKKAFKYYLAVFFLNGINAAILGFHQMYPDINVDSNSFMLLTRIVMIVLSFLLIICSSNKSFKVNKKAIGAAIGNSTFNSLANLLLLIALLYLPTSVQFTIVTGGSIVFSVIISVLLKEKNTARDFISAAIAFVSTIFMVI